MAVAVACQLASFCVFNITRLPVKAQVAPDPPGPVAGRGRGARPPLDPSERTVHDRHGPVWRYHAKTC